MDEAKLNEKAFEAAYDAFFQATGVGTWRVGLRAAVAAYLAAEQPATQAPVPELLQGVLSGTRDGLTVEDYARMAQASPEQWEESLIDNVVELSPDQFCALFDLARAALTQHAHAAPVQAFRRDWEDIARNVAKYHAEKAGLGGASYEFHARAQTFAQNVLELAKRSPEPAQAVAWPTIHLALQATINSLKDQIEAANRQLACEHPDEHWRERGAKCGLCGWTIGGPFLEQRRTLEAKNHDLRAERDNWVTNAEELEVKLAAANKRSSSATELLTRIAVDISAFVNGGRCG